MLAALALLGAAFGAVAEEFEEDGRDASSESHAGGFGPPPPPLGARFAESLEGSRFRVGYRFERIRYAGLRTGDDHLTPDQVRAFGFPETPRALDSTVHTVSVAYAPHPRVTLVVELPYVQNEYERFDVTSMVRREHQAEGLGDVGFAVVVPFIRKGVESSQVHLGLDVPTGSIRRGAEGRPLPYAAQPGNGSVVSNGAGPTRESSTASRGVGRSPGAIPSVGTGETGARDPASPGVSGASSVCSGG